MWEEEKKNKTKQVNQFASALFDFEPKLDRIAGGFLLLERRWFLSPLQLDTAVSSKFRPKTRGLRCVCSN